MSDVPFVFKTRLQIVTENAHDCTVESGVSLAFNEFKRRLDWIIQVREEEINELINELKGLGGYDEEVVDDYLEKISKECEFIQLIEDVMRGC